MPINPVSASSVPLPSTAIDHHLMHCCKNGTIVHVEKALGNGANVHARDPDGFTVFHHLALCTKRSPNILKGIARYLLEAGADVNAITVYGDTVLHLAAGNDLWLLVDHLLEHGADPNLGAQGNHESLLSRAVQMVSVERVNHLLDHGADLHLTTDQGWTPLCEAINASGQAQTKHQPQTLQRLSAVIDLLIERGASLTGPANVPINPVIAAVRSNAGQALERLIDLGALAGDPRFGTPAAALELLTVAIATRSEATLQTLIERRVGAPYHDAACARLSHALDQLPLDIPPAMQQRVAQLHTLVERVVLQHTVDRSLPLIASVGNEKLRVRL